MLLRFDGLKEGLGNAARVEIKKATLELYQIAAPGNARGHGAKVALYRLKKGWVPDAGRDGVPLGAPPSKCGWRLRRQIGKHVIQSCGECQPEPQEHSTSRPDTPVRRKLPSMHYK